MEVRCNRRSISRLSHCLQQSHIVFCYFVHVLQEEVEAAVEMLSRKRRRW